MESDCEGNMLMLDVENILTLMNKALSIDTVRNTYQHVYLYLSQIK